jgi:hypothetical protein
LVQALIQKERKTAIPGLVPGTHNLGPSEPVEIEVMGGRDEPGHDGNF